MNKLVLTRPTLIMVYGYPGAGKTYFARQLSETLHAAHVQGDRIRYELFDTPRYDRQENEVVSHLMGYMAEEFLNAGISVIYDANVMRLGHRRMLRDLARKTKTQPLLIWLQIDLESAFTRIVKRDRRKADDKYAAPMDRTTFEQLAGQMQNPSSTEDYIVISGKHTFHTQQSAVLKRLFDLGLLSATTASQGIAKPGLVNLVPNQQHQQMGGRVDPTRRNIIIR